MSDFPKIKNLLCVSTLFSFLCAPELVVAAPQHPKPQGMRPKFEMRQRQMEELRAQRQAERAARQQARIDQQAANANAQSSANAAAQAPPVSLSTTVQQNQGTIERDQKAIKLNRLTPEERVALRKQIREARREIYLQRIQ